MRRSPRRCTVSETTVKTHVGHMLTKLGLRDRVQAVVWLTRQGSGQDPERLSGSSSRRSASRTRPRSRPCCGLRVSWKARCHSEWHDISGRQTVTARRRRPRGGCVEGVRLGRGAGHRAARGEPGGRTRTVHGHHGSVRLGQVDADALPGRAGLGDPGPGRHRRHRGDRAVRRGTDQAAPREGGLRLPAVQPAAHADRGGEHPAAAGDRRPQAGQGVVRHGYRHGRPGRPARPPPEPALRRPAAAGGVRAGARRRGPR